MVKLGKGEKTVDPVFNEQRDAFNNRYKEMQKLTTTLEKYERCARELALVHAELTEHIQNMYDASCPLWQACMENQKSAADIDNYRLDLEEILKDQIRAPLNDYLQQYRTIAQRIKERQTRMHDMDRVRSSSHKALENPDPNDPRAIAAREKVAAHERAYNELNEELVNDIPKLLGDRYYFDPLFAKTVDAQMAFFDRTAQAIVRLGPCFQTVDRNAAYNHPPVITPDERSAANRKANDYLSAGDSQHMGGPDAYAGGHDTHMGAPPDHGAAAGGYGAHPSAGAPAPYGGAHDPGMRSAPPGGPGVPAGYQPGYGAPPPGMAGRGAPGYAPVSGGPQRGGYGGRGGSGIRQAPPGGQPQPGYGAPRGPAPPRPGGAPGPLRARALYPFQAEDETEVSFQFNDIIIVHQQQGEWWEGEVNGRVGLFPASYVQLI